MSLAPKSAFRLQSMQKAPMQLRLSKTTVYCQERTVRIQNAVPKSKSFDHFTQETVNLIFSHVNAVKRKLLNGKTPYEMFSFMFGESTASVLGIEKIPAADVVQSPKLLKNKPE